jgi:hypothetical protein
MSDQTFPEPVPADDAAEVVADPAGQPVMDITPEPVPVTQDVAAPPVTPVPPAALPAEVAAADAVAPAQWPSAGYPGQGGVPAQPGYPAPYAAYPPPPAGQTSNNAVVGLILAVVSWVVCPLIAAIVALIFANLASKEIEASGGRVEGQGLVTATRWVAWINIGVVAAAIVISVFIALLIAIATGMNAG